jgi:hypothetical protein
MVACSTVMRQPRSASLRIYINWLQVFWNQKLLAAVIKEANGIMREQSGQKNAWHSWAEVG